jgi:hypothetical protein
MTSRQLAWQSAAVMPLVLLAAVRPAWAEEPSSAAEVTEPLPPPKADTEAESASVAARELFLHAVKLGQGGQWREAALEFERSAVLDERSNTVFNLALSHEEAGNYLRAVGAWERFLQIAPADSSADRERATDGALRAQARLTTVALQLAPPTLAVWVDQSASPSTAGAEPKRRLYVNPGPHVLEFKAAGYAGVTWRFDATPGTTLEHSVTLEPVNPVTPGTSVLRIPRPAASHEPVRKLTARESVEPHAQVPVPPSDNRLSRSVPAPLWKSPVFWLAAGALLLGGGIVTYVALRPGENRIPEKGTGGSIDLQL